MWIIIVIEIRKIILYVHECTRRCTLAFPSKTAAREISYSMEWICANSLHDNYINYPRTEKRAGAESFTFVSNDWLNKFVWILNVSYITLIVSLRNVCSLWIFLLIVMDADFYVNIRFLIEKLVGNVETIASDIRKWDKIKISISDLFIHGLRLQVRITVYGDRSDLKCSLARIMDSRRWKYDYTVFH